MQRSLFCTTKQATEVSTKCYLYKSNVLSFSFKDGKKVLLIGTFCKVKTFFGNVKSDFVPNNRKLYIYIYFHKIAEYQKFTRWKKLQKQDFVNCCFAKKKTRNTQLVYGVDTLGRIQEVELINQSL